MSDDYSRALARVSVGQLAELAGFEAVQESAGEVLSELLIKYITELSASAHSYAELANRSGANLHDLLLALDDLGTSVPELQGYLASLTPEANSFAHVVTAYPIRKPARSLPTWQDKQEAPPPHIPAFLPAFPDKHTFQSTPTFAGHETHPDKQSKVAHKARKVAESALLKLHHATTVAAKPPRAATAPAAAAVEGAGGGNPFTAPPAITVVAVGTAAAPGEAAAGGSSGGGGGVPAGYQPHAARAAFAPALGGGVAGEGDAGVGPADDQEAQGAAGQGGMDIDIQMGQDGIMTNEELYWRYQPRLDDKGGLLRPLGTSADYATLTSAAATTYTVGAAEADAYEEAAKEEAAAAVGGTGHARKRKSAYGSVVDPTRRRAQEVLERAKDPSAALAEGEE